MIENRRRKFRDIERIHWRKSGADCGDSSILRQESILTREEKVELKKRIMNQL